MSKEVVDYTWEVPRVTVPSKLWFLTDQHLGNADCAVAHIKQVRDQIAADPTSRVILGGDCCDFVNFTDSRFDIRSIAPAFQGDLDNLAIVMANQFVEIYKPIAKQIICLVPGNHDDKIRQRYHQDIAAIIAGSLGVPYMQQVRGIRIRFEDNIRYRLVQGVMSHAERGGSTAAGKLTAALRMAADYDDIDFFALAHTHEYMHRNTVRIAMGGRFGRGRRKDRVVQVVLTGGYLKTYGDGFSGYGAKKGYSPCKLGSPHMKIHLRRHSGGGRAAFDELETSVE